ncbi:MAG TPA: Ppx/GppA phosphatase family protein [Gracilimonas sp.]|uniref:Ppx/GppA phosphatase family protein n=1 Tax=Gracilimonas sp. TaxID=1974203 RepID=UPI002D9B175A|nr:Ppx/GppA phosphatase family protein [Gracilimonas sp.]
MKAAIDIGTNTVLLLIAELENGIIKPIHEEHRVPRLGKGVDADKNINEAATQRVISALKDFKDIITSDFPKVDTVTVTATSAVRDAKNRQEFIQKIKNETGFTIQLLSGKEEAEWTAAGALSVLEVTEEETLILDIGGGSTEVAQVKEDSVLDAHSYDMGSVRFTERFLHEDPPTGKQILTCKKEIKHLFDSRPFSTNSKVHAVGVAGTVTTLAGMVLDLKEYHPEKLNGHALTVNDIQSVISEFSSTASNKMLEKHPVYLKGRADIFLAGMLILEGFMTQYGLEKLIVSIGGIRHGAVINSRSL